MSLIFAFTSTPGVASAGIFSNLLGGDTATAEGAALATEEESGMFHNSQTMPLLETSINPDTKNASEEDPVIIQDDSFIYNNGPIGADISYERSPISDKIYVYTVQKGDTLSEIAELFDISTNTIRWENKISGQSISVGQKLNILPVTGVRHTVKSGDTIQKIADKYEADAEDIYIFNDLNKESVLKVGDIIFVPNGIISQPVTAPSSKNSSSPSKSSNTKVDTGYYARPVAGIITSKYGSRKGGFHYGVDIGNARGTSIRAAASGTVVKVVSGCKEGNSSCGGRYGNYIVISHSNGTKTFYAHLSSVGVSYGEKVSQGDVIGALGNTGRSTGPHLHFEIENANGSKMRPPF
ncbi:MAG: M23 family metallopeptidase [Candidatus Moranbacteria bacterium]|nr:M23 family metallopeptidase [Candidatus Moranbacteria bacterium]